MLVEDMDVKKEESLYDFYIPVYTGVNPDTGAAEWERYYDDVNGNGTFDDDTDVIITSLAAISL